MSTKSLTTTTAHSNIEIDACVPAEGIALVRGEVFYNLLWPGRVKKFSHLPTDLTDPVLIAEYEQTIAVN